MSETLTTAPTLEQQAREIADEIAAQFADDVDRQARFPVEAIDALRSAGLLAMALPVGDGGASASMSELCDVARMLGQRCAATAMIFAMHQSQIVSLVRHGGEPVRGFLQEIGTKGLLIASATTEIGIGGDIRTSSCAVEPAGDRVFLAKTAPVISYGEHSDAILVTARRSPDSAPTDQVLVVCRRTDTVLTQLSEWNTLGLRGTCSPGFKLTADVPAEMVIGDPYANISAQTMLPASHCLWSAVWLGIAEGALEKAQRFARRAARKDPGTVTPAALRLAEAFALHQQFADLVTRSARRYEERAFAGSASDGDIGYSLAMNNLKVTASQLVVDVVAKALLICGISGYREDSEFSLGRSLRDAYGASLMVNNDRIMANSAQLSVVAGGLS
ncbi:acyl-CoA dehydrogenase [Skermania sp. ID1734]|uniref:acyl-CoA dehydrogenase family protein n=1 Tax=Skermania sp. ID1734 TaxID=2597516 RepID=UPI00117D3ECD|nr:acyl-CoA dehydrogenase family protein [Skermania sp. ID1734]TSE00387.1 acyl-CoA dehydrogenase [Skermania sp. ID1734]